MSLCCNSVLRAEPLGITWCQMLLGDLDDAAQQLEFLAELQASGAESPVC